MTERCQTKFTEKFENQNYVIYVGILVASLAVLYVYRFHFATIACSYVLGCVACYYGLNSNVLDSLVNKVQCHAVVSGVEDDEESGAELSGCATCGMERCRRHDAPVAAEPWDGLLVHKQLDQAIENFYNAILKQFVSGWHGRAAAAAPPCFLHELRLQLRRASAVLLRRAREVDYARLLAARLLPCALRHFALHGGGGGAGGGGGSGAGAAPPPAVHPAAASRAAELKYLRSLTETLMPLLLDDSDLQDPVFLVLVREIFAGWVLLPLADLLADPYILNALVLLAAGDETMARLPTAPDYRVEFLSSFVGREGRGGWGAERARLLGVELERAVGEPAQLYAFMRHVSNTPDLLLLEFYKDFKQFQSLVLNPAPSGREVAALGRAGAELLARHDAAALRHGRLRARRPELRALLRDGTDLATLQTSPALFAATSAARAALTDVLLGRFLHTDEFYNMLIGPRVPTGYHKQYKRERVVRSLSVLPPAREGGGLLLDSGGADRPDDDSPDDEELLAYLDRLAADDLPELLGSYKVSLTDVHTAQQAPPRTGTVRVFTVAVYCGGRLWEVQRSEHDFHLLRAKLLEFHGDRPLSHLPLPSRRDNSPDETLRYKYEDFLQLVLRAPLLQASELLRLFLSAPAFSAAAAAAPPPDLAQVYRTVAHRLRKEKGQHLETFLRSFLLSADMERYQALKQGAGVEEAREVSEEADEGEVGGTEGRRGPRNFHSPVFEDNFGVRPAVELADTALQHSVVGFSQCLMYLLMVSGAPGWARRLVGGALGAAPRALDAAAERALNNALASALEERRLAHLITLGHDILFGSTPRSARAPAARQRAAARAALLGAVPGAAALALGATLQALGAAFDLLQRPAHNKQLVYNLLDLCVLELFPELGADTRSEPKS